MNTKLRAKKLISAAAIVAAGVGGSVGVNIAFAPPASAVAYCSYYHHYGSCTWQERYQISLIYWNRINSSISNVIRAMGDANAGIVRNIR